MRANRQCERVGSGASSPLHSFASLTSLTSLTALALGALAALVPLAGCASEHAAGSTSTGEAPPATDTGHPTEKSEPANVVGGFTIDVPPITLEAGGEQQPCYIFPLVIKGASHMVGGGKLTVGPGMHHGNITTRPKTGEGVRPCPMSTDATEASIGLDIVKGGAVLFGSSTQVAGTEWQSFPPGMAYSIREGFEVVARMHYLNTASKAVTVAPVYEWFTVDESKVTQVLGPFAWQYPSFDIPPLATYTASADCSFPGPMHIVTLLPHMHKLGTRFTGSFLGGPHDRQRFLDSPGYDPNDGVMVQYDHAVDLSQGDGASFACTWKNTYDKSIVEGVGDNEMCILFGYAYPPTSAYSATASDTSCIYIAPPP